ncbi:hypothetical protein [Sagittula stellata]|uniref:hypothetical protein n=1 Tax=Sagittula stellata TaxID=52603 RepID=UPI0032198C95
MTKASTQRAAQVPARTKAHVHVPVTAPERTQNAAPNGIRSGEPACAQAQLPAHVPVPRPVPAHAPAGGAQQKPVPRPMPIPPPGFGPGVRSGARIAGPARLKRRHWSLMLSFVLGVLLPAAAVAWYLWDRAADQYASTVAFSVRTEETNSALELLGGLAPLSGSSSSDTDILYEYLQSQKLVAEIDAAVNLRAIWSKPGATDPYFAFDPDGTIEDLVDHWQRMVKIYYDDGAGLIEVRVLAFEARDAQLVAETLYDRSTEMINALLATAREDAIRYARADLGKAEDRLKAAREALTSFRNRNQMVDPTADMERQSGVLANLEGLLANELIEYDLLALRTRADDPRLTQAESRIGVIRDRIAAERRKLGLAGGAVTDEVTGENGVYADLFGEYERLVVDREFAEATYTSARAAYDASVAEARRQSRYLTAYVRPTLAQSPRYPEREMLLALATLLILLVWGTLVLVIYALKDRR